MRQILRWALVVVLAGTGTLASAAMSRADVNGVTATNVQDGQNSSTSNQSGTGKTGSSVGGQVSGVVSSGRASVDARNTSKDSDVSSGEVHGSNTANSYVGLNSTEGSTSVGADVTGSCNGEGCDNVQDGNNRYSLSQTLSAVSGDGVGGQVIGLVANTAAEPSIVASNTSDGVDVSTGDADGTNSSAAFVGLNSSDGGPSITADITGDCTDTDCENVQDGSNRISSRQAAWTQTGDGVGGQVIGAVTNSATSIDARNTTTDSSVETGDAGATNDAAYFAGLNTSEAGPTITASDVTDSCTAGCDNVQDGSNRVTSNQTARSTSGDGVAGQVIGAVGAGGSMSIAAANTTRDSDVTTGDSDATNDLAAFVGLNDSGAGPAITSDITGSCNGEGCDNLQDGSNTLSGSQSAHSATGDGVAGEVIGVVAAGNTSVDATNNTWDSSVETGDATSDNSAATFVGLNSSDFGPTVTATDIGDATATNLQDGSNRRTFTQNADATSGDGVAGQVAGIVTSAGGSASVVLANTSSDIDSSSGESRFTNDDSNFIGLNVSTGGPLVG